MDDGQRIETVKRYLRRTYAANPNGLKTLAEKIFNSGATSPVTITGNTFEGGSGQGTVTFEPLAYLQAIEDVIAEIDPAAPLAAPDSARLSFRQIN